MKFRSLARFALAFLLLATVAFAQTAAPSFTAPDGSFSIDFPSKPVVRGPEQGQTANGEVYTRSFYAVKSDDKNFFEVGTADYGTNVTAENLSNAMESVTAKGELLSQREIEGYPGPALLFLAHVVISSGPQKIAVLLVADQKRMYMVIFGCPLENGDKVPGEIPAAFFNSFTINPVKTISN